MKIFRILVVFLLQIILVISNIANIPTNKDFDLIIKNGRIIDGTGNPWFYGDIAIKNGKNCRNWSDCP